MQGNAGLEATAGPDLVTRREINAQLAEMGCPYRVGDERLEAWQQGYRAGLRFAMGGVNG